MNGAFAVLVVTERLQWQWKQGRLFFGEHCRYLTLGCAVNARVGPAPLPIDPDTTEPLRDFRNAVPSAVSFWRGRRQIPLFLCDPDLGRDTAWRRRRSAPAHL